MLTVPRPLRTPWTIVEIFILGNLAFLTADVFIAHSVNNFEQWQEWVPVVFSLTAPALLLAVMILAGVSPRDDYPQRSLGATARRRIARWIGLIVGWVAVTVGVAGMVFHLQSQFFEERTIRSLVYTAPFVAPLAYAGLGMLLILDRMVESEEVRWAQWIVFLALGGFAGNFVLSLADHAQNGFFHRTEWIPVIASALAIGFLLMVVVSPRDERLRAAAWAILALQGVVGVAGFLLHARADYYNPAPQLWDRFVYGAPVFAPLLFPNLAILAAIGLWSLGRNTRHST